MSDMATEFVHRSFTVDEYHRIAQAGIFRSGERVELLDGLIGKMPPIGVPHWTTQSRVLENLFGRLAGRATISADISIPLGDRNEPQPDIAILAKLPYRKLARAPLPAEIYAVIELSEASLAQDLGAKRRLYARCGISDYLVADLAGDVLLHFSQPFDFDYPEPRRLGAGETFTLSCLPDLAIAADPFLDER